MTDTPDSLRDQQLLMDGIYWYGIPTLFRAPHDADPANADIGLVGDLFEVLSELGEKL